MVKDLASLIIGEARMTKEKLIEKIKAILVTDDDLDFLRGLKKEELEKLLASIRDRLYQAGK
jgi:hypothetical protein